MIERHDLVKRIQKSLDRSRITALLGPRQCGKTTLAKKISNEKVSHYFDLEDPVDEARLENPQFTLRNLEGLIIIDEVQRKPELFSLLRTLADRDPLPARFLILGSASLDLARHSLESLAGRVEFVEMDGFDLSEIGFEHYEKLWVRGRFPLSFLAANDEDSVVWRENFIRTFLERDLPQMGVSLPAATVRRFWTMLAHYHGQVWNASAIGVSLGLSHTTVRRYLDILSGALVLHQLPPWIDNVKKRLVKSPKVYIRDSGIIHSLLHLPSRQELLGHPKLGASWEGFVLDQALNFFGSRDIFFWATHAGAEIDLVLPRKGKLWGFEFKFADAPRITKSMRNALAELNLEKLWVVYPGETDYQIHDKIEVIGLRTMAKIVF
ncbi:MAG: ATP-binding protein [Desulfobacteraceae bacterium]|nr:MAG: ATP-binding protein [Desulfobacteraceae bacterium]